MMNVKPFSNILYYDIKRNPVTVFLSVDINVFHQGWQSIQKEDLMYIAKLFCVPASLHAN